MNKDVANTYSQKKWEYAVKRVEKIEKKIAEYKEFITKTKFDLSHALYQKWITELEQELSDLKNQYPGKL